MIYNKDTAVQLNPAGGIPTITVRANCATSDTEIDLQSADRQSWKAIATVPQNTAVRLNDGTVNSGGDLKGRQAEWLIGLAITDMNDPHDVGLAVVIKQDGNELAGSIHDSLDLGTSKSCVAYGYVTFQ